MTARGGRVHCRALVSGLGWDARGGKHLDCDAPVLDNERVEHVVVEEQHGVLGLQLEPPPRLAEGARVTRGRAGGWAARDLADVVLFGKHVRHHEEEDVLADVRVVGDDFKAVRV